MNHSQDAGRQLASEVVKSRDEWSRRLSYSFLAHFFLYPPHVPSVETARPSLKRSTYPLSFPHMRVISNKWPHTYHAKVYENTVRQGCTYKKKFDGGWVHPGSGQLGISQFQAYATHISGIR